MSEELLLLVSGGVGVLGALPEAPLDELLAAERLASSCLRRDSSALRNNGFQNCVMVSLSFAPMAKAILSGFGGLLAANSSVTIGPAISTFVPPISMVPGAVPVVETIEPLRMPSGRSKR